VKTNAAAEKSAAAQGYSLHATALPDVHQTLLTAAAALGTDQASPAQRKAYQICPTRLTSGVTTISR
jgi:putative DNA-invertase from lambdoid prophage Rac